MDTQDKVLLGYHTQKLLADTRHDHQEIDKYLEKLSKPPENTRERLLQERIDRRLNIIPDHDFQKVIEKLPPEHAKTLTAAREQERAEEKARDIAREQDRDRSISRSR